RARQPGQSHRGHLRNGWRQQPRGEGTMRRHQGGRRAGSRRVRDRWPAAFPALVLAASLTAAGCASAPPAASPAAETDRWEPDIQAFEAADREQPPTPGGVVFVGSSSIRMWETLQEDFEGLDVVNRGFGGSEM